MQTEQDGPGHAARKEILNNSPPQDWASLGDEINLKFGPKDF